MLKVQVSLTPAFGPVYSGSLEVRVLLSFTPEFLTSWVFLTAQLLPALWGPGNRIMAFFRPLSALCQALQGPAYSSNPPSCTHLPPYAFLAPGPDCICPRSCLFSASTLLPFPPLSCPWSEPHPVYTSHGFRYTLHA